jgi:alpha-glucosidase
MNKTQITVNRSRVTGPVMLVLLLLCMVGLNRGQEQNRYELRSPDGSVRLAVTTGEQTTISVSLDGKLLVDSSPVSITVNDRLLPGKNPMVLDARRRMIRQKITPVLPEKFAVIDDHYNELTLEFKNSCSLIFRAYNNGVAYRFRTDLNGDIKVASEQAVFNFSGNDEIYYPEEESFFSHNERTYLHMRLDTVAAGRLASLPVLVITGDARILIEESALTDYPGMWVRTGGSGKLEATFPHFPLESRTKPGSDRNVPVTKDADYIAMTKGRRSFPWRILALAGNDGDLITNQLVYQLGEEQQIGDPSWIRPGKVAWDWWNANNIYGVDFRSGIDTDTYKYYIDFASKYRIEYIILDEGWYKLGNLFEVVPEMNVPELIAYGRQKHVGVILWVVWKTLDDQLIPALDQFQKWGAAGIKVDFMQRSDQEMVNFYRKVASEAAKRKMLVDFHGAFKPSGLRRAYPNVITREGVKGLEHCKWSADITPTHDLTLPFTRMVTGPMDFTPGAMINAQPGTFRIVFTRPMSMGTRMHQIAMYIIYESPLQMMADCPSNYLKEAESTAFIAQIPTTWEDTRVLEARVGEYLVLARKNGGKWYIGAMTDENPRNFTISLAFLDDGKYTSEIMEDGVNADRYAQDYRRILRTVVGIDSLTIRLAPGGGWAAILTPEK